MFLESCLILKIGAKSLIGEYLKKSARNFGSVLLGIESGSVEGFNELCKRMKDNGFSYEDITDDDVLAQILI